MSKRGQISTFIIIGLLVLSAMGFLLLLRNYSAQIPEPSTKISLDEASIKEYRNFCLERKVREGIDYFGVMPGAAKNIENYIENRLEECANFEEYIGKGVEITAGDVDAKVTITEDAVIVDVEYPVTIITKDEELSFSSFNYYMPREKQTKLNLNQNQETATTINIVSEDRDAEITIPEGTKVSDENGNPINQISLKVLERNFDGLNNAPVIGMVVYEGLPDGAHFEPAITVKIHYNTNEIPPGIEEESLKIAWFDKDKGLWWGLPTTVDTVNHILSAEVYHFTPISVSACTPEISSNLFNAEIPESELADTENFRSDIQTAKEGKIEYFVYVLQYLPLFEQTCGESYKEGDCLPPTEWNDESRGWHEDQENPAIKNPQLLSGLNPPLPTMVTYGECVEDVKERDWDGDDQNDEASHCSAQESDGTQHTELDGACKKLCLQAANSYYSGLEDFKSGDGIKDEGYEECICFVNCAQEGNCEIEGKRFGVATAATYGYDGDGTSPGGWAKIPFNVGSKGDACIMRDNMNDPRIWLTLLCSPGDTCGGNRENKMSIDEKDPTQFTLDFKSEDIKFNPTITPTQNNKWAIGHETDIKAGLNELYMRIQNTDYDGCVWAEAELKIEGIGITWTPSDCKVQDAINAICLKTDPPKPDGSGYPKCPNGFGGAYNYLLGRIVVDAPNKFTGGDVTNPAWRTGPVSQLDPELYAEVSAWCAAGSTAPANKCGEEMLGTCKPMADTFTGCAEGEERIPGDCGLGNNVCCAPEVQFLCVDDVSKLKRRDCVQDNCYKIVISGEPYPAGAAGCQAQGLGQKCCEYDLDLNCRSDDTHFRECWNPPCPEGATFMGTCLTGGKYCCEWTTDEGTCVLPSTPAPTNLEKGESMCFGSMSWQCISPPRAHSIECGEKGCNDDTGMCNIE